MPDPTPAPTCTGTKPLSLPCPDCQGERQHYVRISTTKGEQGQRRRVLACTVCEREASIPTGEQPGICCPKCGDIRLTVVFTRHRKGQTVRVKRCFGCKHRVRTKEVIESYAA